MESTVASTSKPIARSAHRPRAAIVGALILLAYSMLIYDTTGNIPFGSAADIISGLAVIGIAVLMFPLFRRDRSGAISDSAGNKVVCGAYLFCKAMEGVLMIAGGICILFASARDYRAVLYDNFHIYFFIAGALLFYGLFFRTRLVPRLFSVWGLIATVVLIAVTALRLAGIENVILDAMLMPIVLNEVGLAIWLMVKGFNR